MRAKTRALTALALLASLALAAATLHEQRGAPSHTTQDLSPAAEGEHESTPPPGALDAGAARPSDSLPSLATPREVAALDVPAEDRGDAGPELLAGVVSGRVVDGTVAPIAGAELAVSPFDRLGERLVDPFAPNTGSGIGSGIGSGAPSTGPGAQHVEPGGASHLTATGADGRFVLALPPADVVRLVARARGFAPLERTLRPGRRNGDDEPSAGIDLGDLALEPGAVLVGAVRTRAGAPVADAVVHRLDPVNRAAAVAHAGLGDVVARTDAAGRFRVAELHQGAWKLLIASAAHPDAVFEGASAGTADAPLERDFVLADGARITGHVLGADSLNEGLVVRALPIAADFQPRAVALDASLAFEIAGLAPGARYRVAAWRSGDDPSARPRSDDALVTSGATGVELRLVPAATIEFRAVEAATGAPVTEFEAHLVDDTKSAAPSVFLAGLDGRALHAHPGGVASFPVVRPSLERTVTLVVWGRHHAPRSLPGLVCTPGQRLDLGDVVLQPADALEVTVLSAADGAPIAGAHVALDLAREAGYEPLGAVLQAPSAPPWRRARTDASGRALLTGLPRAALTLEVRHAQFAPRAQWPITESDVAAGRAEVRLEPR